MRIKNKEQAILEFITTLYNDKDSVLTEISYAGDYKVKGDAGKKGSKYQCIDGKLALPHAYLNDKNKENIMAITHSVLFQNMLIKKEFLSEEAIKCNNDNNKKAGIVYSKYPKVIKALNNLVEVLKEASEEEVEKLEKVQKKEFKAPEIRYATEEEIKKIENELENKNKE